MRECDHVWHPIEGYCLLCSSFSDDPEDFVAEEVDDENVDSA